MIDPADDAALIRRFYDEVFNAGNVDFAEQVHGPGYRRRLPARAVVTTDGVMGISRCFV
jgi:hypothetical protein